MFAKKIRTLPRIYSLEKILGKILKMLKSRFDFLFLEKVNEVKQSYTDHLDHNKLRTYIQDCKIKFHQRALYYLFIYLFNNLQDSLECAQSS